MGSNTDQTYEPRDWDAIIAGMDTDRLQAFSAYVECLRCEREAMCLLFYRFCLDLSDIPEDAVSRVLKCQVARRKGGH